MGRHQRGYAAAMRRPGLVLDFDGVLVDSAPEAYVVARRTYAELGPALPAPRGLAV